MRAKHLHIESDSKLLAEIRRRVQDAMTGPTRAFRATMLLKLVVYASLSATLYAGLYFPSSKELFVVNYIALGLVLLLFAFNFAHDFSHNTIFQNKRWNSLGFIALYTLVGAHAEAWRERHVNSHHFAPNVKEYDSDLQITSIIRVSPDMPYRWYHRFQHAYALLAYSTYSLYWITIKDFTLLFQKISHGEASASYLLSFLVQKLFYLSYMLVCPLLISGQAWTTLILGFVLMHAVQSIFLLLTFFMTHHVLETTYPTTNEEGIIQTSWLMNQVESSNDMHPFSETANFILGGFNNHIAHHLFPHIHHIHYPRLNRVLYQVLREHGITPNQTSYLGGAWSHLQLLKQLSRKDAVA